MNQLKFSITVADIMEAKKVDEITARILLALYKKQLIIDVHAAIFNILTAL